MLSVVSWSGGQFLQSCGGNNHFGESGWDFWNFYWHFSISLYLSAWKKTSIFDLTFSFGLYSVVRILTMKTENLYLLSADTFKIFYKYFS